MAQSINSNAMEQESKIGTSNTNAVDTIAEAILKAVDNRVKKSSKDNTNTRKNIISALGYKPASADTLSEKYYTKTEINSIVPTLPNGTYTLTTLIVNGFVHNGNELRVWIPLPVAGKTVSVETTGNVSIKHSTDGYISCVPNSVSNSVSKQEFEQCELYYGSRSVAGFRLRIASQDGWFKSKTGTVAQNNMVVSVSFDTACVITVS